MATRVEIVLTGIGVLALENGGRHSTGATDARAFLVDASDPDWSGDGMPVHRPVLSFRARDYEQGGLGSEKVEISERGEEIVQLDLSNENVLVGGEGAKAAKKSFGVNWVEYDYFDAEGRRGIGEGHVVRIPRIPADAGALDWIPQLCEYRLEDFDVHSPPKKGVVSVVQFSSGSFESRDVLMEAGQPVPVEFEPAPQDETRDVPGENARKSSPIKPLRTIANRIVYSCEVPEEEYFAVTVGGENLLFSPKDGNLLRFAITNLPASAPLDGVRSSNEAIRHMSWLAKLAKDPDAARKNMYLPRVKGVSHTILSGICPFSLLLYSSEGS